MLDNIFVSILVATKNRPLFAENILRNFIRQDYPQEQMELIIVDDGECKMESLIPKEENIFYYKFDNISLGNKRNKLCELSKGEILIFMDDDDYYPEDKVSTYVNTLNNSTYQVAGGSTMFVFYSKLNIIYRFGPYGKFHATCGTLGFKKEYFENNKFPDVNKAEERIFLNNYTTPLIQINPFKSILVIAHDNNTVDKYKYLHLGKITNLTLDNFNLKKSDKIFYLNLKKTKYI